MTVIMRSFMDSCKGFFSPETRQRAKEHLLSIGYREEDLQPIVWPEDALSAHRDHAGQPWKFTTKVDIRRQRQEDAKQTLQRIRKDGAMRRVPLYVWVFHCPGIFGADEIIEPLDTTDLRSVHTTGIMGGWYTYLIGQNMGQEISLALNFRGDWQKMIDRVMELFPLVKATTLFDGPDFDEWMLLFVERYPKGLWCDVPQGKAPVWAEVEGGQVKRILGRAKWRSN